MPADLNDLRQRLEYLELDGSQVANVLAILEAAIADATTEQTRRAEWYALLAIAFQQRVLAIDADGYMVTTTDVDGNECTECYDGTEGPMGLPVEEPNLRAALADKGATE